MFRLIGTVYCFFMMTSPNGNIFRVTGPLCGEFTGHRWIPSQRLVTRSFDVFFDLRLNKRLSKQSWCWWFDTSSRSLWRHCNVVKHCWHERQVVFVWKQLPPRLISPTPAIIAWDKLMQSRYATDHFANPHICWIPRGIIWLRSTGGSS